MSPTIDRPTVVELETVIDLWMALVDDQQTHGTRILAAENERSVREWFGRLLVLDGVRVAKRGDEIIGFVSFEIERDKFARTGCTGRIHNLYVIEDERGCGTGSTLLNAAEAALADQGADHVQLETMATNTRAQSFYDANGYRPHRTIFEKPIEETDKHN